ncbi:hypothetical protein [Streptomyces melanogenes]
MGLLDEGFAENKESDGAFHTALYLSRPAAGVADVPLSALLGGGL